MYSIFLSGMREDCVTISRLKLAKLPSDFQCSFPIHSNSSLSFYLRWGGKSGLMSYENFGHTSYVCISYICIDIHIYITIDIDILMLP